MSLGKNTPTVLQAQNSRRLGRLLSTLSKPVVSCITLHTCEEPTFNYLYHLSYRLRLAALRSPDHTPESGTAATYSSPFVAPVGAQFHFLSGCSQLISLTLSSVGCNDMPVANSLCSIKLACLEVLQLEFSGVPTMKDIVSHLDMPQPNFLKLTFRRPGDVDSVVAAFWSNVAQLQQVSSFIIRVRPGPLLPQNCDAALHTSAGILMFYKCMPALEVLDIRSRHPGFSHHLMQLAAADATAKKATDIHLPALNQLQWGGGSAFSLKRFVLLRHIWGIIRLGSVSIDRMEMMHLSNGCCIADLEWLKSKVSLIYL
ncbi:hypothetical protein C8J57DRAFT_1223727 [Mycena rebaudengoi]|nr:hypothetical protein C8J57DRAFT_1223727 [Mycena rebaudengoi]